MILYINPTKEVAEALAMKGIIPVEGMLVMKGNVVRQPNRYEVFYGRTKRNVVRFIYKIIANLKKK